MLVLKDTSIYTIASAQTTLSVCSPGRLQRLVGSGQEKRGEEKPFVGGRWERLWGLKRNMTPVDSAFATVRREELERKGSGGSGGPEKVRGLRGVEVEREHLTWAVILVVGSAILRFQERARRRRAASRGVSPNPASPPVGECFGTGRTVVAQHAYSTSYSRGLGASSIALPSFRGVDLSGRWQGC